MATDVRCGPVHYRLLSEHFHACAELSEREREEYLSGASVHDDTLREELRSLLQYHAPRPRAVRPERGVKPGPVRAAKSPFPVPISVSTLVLGAALVLLALAIRGWSLGRLEESMREDRVRRLQEMLDWRVSSFRAWVSRKKELTRGVLEDPLLVSYVETLAAAVHGPGNPGDNLRSSPAYAPLVDRLSPLPAGLGKGGFCIATPSGMVLCSSPGDAAGRSLSASSAAFLRAPAMGEWLVSRPCSDRQLGLTPEEEPARPVVCLGGPVRNDQGQVIAFAVFVCPPQDEFYGFFSSPGPSEFLVFDERSLLLNNVKDTAPLKQAGLLPVWSDAQTALRVHLRDPGRTLKDGISRDLLPEHLPPTHMCLSSTQGGSGSNSTGYRNLVGRSVIGAWTWLPEQEMGIGVEEDVELLLSSLRPIQSGFMMLMSVLALLTGFLSFLLGRSRLLRAGRPDSHFGFYVVERAIGQGGVGDVYLATHTILNRPTALKILRDPRPDRATLSRFKREARMASRLGHPNSIQIFDYGETSDGRLYYAMEYVEGLNLAQLLTLEGTMSVARALYLLRQISGALEEAHALGLLHRDLKPSNVMVGRKGGLGDVVKILDFGIASSVSGKTEDVTQSANIVGTPAYMAPERIRRPQHLDFRSDVYSFGGVAFHILTGRSLFEGPGPAELIYQVLTSKRPSPSQLRGDPLPPALEALILDCLAIEPESRPLSMSEITEQLRSIEISEPWSQDEARAWWTQNQERVARFKAAAS